MLEIILGVIVVICLLLIVIAVYNNKFQLVIIKIDKAEEDISIYLDKKKELLDRTKPIIKKELKLDSFLDELDNSFEDKTYEEFKRVVDTNLTGTYYLTKLLSKKIANDGNILFISSTNGIDTPYIESIDYDASKAGVISLMHNFAKYLKPIRVNTIAPGWVNTKMNASLYPKFKEAEERKILLKRFAKPEEISKVIKFVISRDASYINDTVIRVDGGVYNE